MKSFPRLLWGTAFLVRLQCSALKGGSGFAMGAPVVLRTKVAPIRETCAQVLMKSFPIALGNGFFSAFAVPALKGGYGFAMGAPVVLRTKVAPIAKPVRQVFNEVVPSFALGNGFFSAFAVLRAKGRLRFCDGRSRGASHQSRSIRKTCAAGLGNKNRAVPSR